MIISSVSDQNQMKTVGGVVVLLIFHKITNLIPVTCDVSLYGVSVHQMIGTSRYSIDMETVNLCCESCDGGVVFLVT